MDNSTEVDSKSSDGITATGQDTAVSVKTEPVEVEETIKVCSSDLSGYVLGEYTFQTRGIHVPSSIA